MHTITGRIRASIGVVLRYLNAFWYGFDNVTSPHQWDFTTNLEISN